MNVKLDDCFQFGIGAFETICVEGGRPVFLDRHLKRLLRTADYLGLGIPEERGIDRDSVMKSLDAQMAEASGTACILQERRSALKIMLTRENVVFSMRYNPYTADRYHRGFVMDISDVRRNETSPLVYHKTMNYGDCILEKRRAAKAGMDERIFLNTKGQICEGTVSNIFFVRNGSLYTPEMSCGLLPGIIREYICETEQVCETVIYPEDLPSYQECFVTNSLMGIMPVRRLGDIRFREHAVTDRLSDIYLSHLANGQDVF